MNKDPINIFTILWTSLCSENILVTPAVINQASIPYGCSTVKSKYPNNWETKRQRSISALRNVRWHIHSQCCLPCSPSSHFSCHLHSRAIPMSYVTFIGSQNSIKMYVQQHMQKQYFGEYNQFMNGIAGLKVFKWQLCHITLLFIKILLYVVAIKIINYFPKWQKIFMIYCRLVVKNQLE